MEINYNNDYNRYLEFMVTIPVFGIVFNGPTLLPDTSIRIVECQLPVHIQHLYVWTGHHIAPD